MTTLRSLPSRRLLLTVAAALSTLTACARQATTGAPAPAPTATADGVLRAMHDRYVGKWYRTLSFRQLTTSYQGGSERKSTWYETLQVPGKLRIDIDLARGTGQLFASDSQYNILNNQVRRAAAGHNVLLVLGFDVYGQPSARTAEILQSLGFPDRPVRDGTWLDRPVWIVGGAPNDLHSPQYWIDKERLVFVRLLQPFAGDTAQTTDIRFGDYRPAGGGWVANRVEFFQNGQRTLVEEYDDVRVNPTVSDALFDPKRWGTAPHWAKAK